MISINILKKYIGKCYKRDTSNGNIAVYKITGIYSKGFLVTHYYLSLGSSVKEANLKMRKTFINRPNFHEISTNEYSAVEYLHKCAGKYEFTN